MNVGSIHALEGQSCRRRSRFLSIAAYALVSTLTSAFLSGCFVNPGQQALPSASMAISITPVYLTVSNSYMTATGSCGDSQMVKIIYSSPLTPSNTVTADCVNGQVTAQLPVAQGTQNQIFTVELMGQLRTSTGSTQNMTVTYAPPIPLTPGFALEIAGAIQSDGGLVSINGTVGEVVTPATLSDGSGNTLRTGVQGVNDP